MCRIKGTVGNSTIVIEKSDTDLQYLLTFIEPDSGEVISKCYCKTALDAVKYSIKAATTREYPDPEIMLKVRVPELDTSVVLSSEINGYEIHIYTALHLMGIAPFMTLEEAMESLMR